MPNIEQETQETQTKPRKKRGGMVFKTVVVLLLAAIVILLALRQCAPAPEDEWTLERELTAELGILPDMTEEEIQDALNRKVAEGMLNVSMNPTPIFPDGKSPGNVRFQNIQGNRYSITVTLVRSDTEEAILSTNLIDPGYYVEEMKLDTPLPAGKYLCVANVAAYDPESLTPIGETGMQVLVTVEK